MTVGYPTSYQGPSLIETQVHILATLFHLDSTNALAFIANRLPSWSLPEQADGWFAMPFYKAVSDLDLTMTSPQVAYARAASLGLNQLYLNLRSVCSKLSLTEEYFRVSEQSAVAMGLLSLDQRSDILIIPAQFGRLHAGKNVQEAHESFLPTEFGLGLLSVCSMLITHPERLSDANALGVTCPGDEYCDSAGTTYDEYSDGNFNEALAFHVQGPDHINIFSNMIRETPYPNSAPVTGFLPAELAALL